MERELEILNDYLSGNESRVPSLHQLQKLAEDYPYFAAPLATILRLYSDDLDEESRRNTRCRLALLMGDTAVAQRSVEGTDIEFYPPDIRIKPNTNDVLDTFFSKYGKTDPQEDALLERLIFNPVPDYLDMLEEVPDAPKSLKEAASEIGSAVNRTASHKPATPDGSLPPHISSDAIDAAASLRQISPTPPASKKDKPEPAEDSLLSESLAKIFIKQGRYERAYEIISNLNLNYPEKSIYFADQLRFLRKIIILQRRNGHSTGHRTDD